MGATAVLYNQSITLADQVNDYLKVHKMTIKRLAQEVNYSRSIVSRYLVGKYDADPPI